MKLSNDLILEKSYSVKDFAKDYTYTEKITLDESDLKEIVKWIKNNKPNLLKGE